MCSRNQAKRALSSRALKEKERLAVYAVIPDQHQLWMLDQNPFEIMT